MPIKYTCPKCNRRFTQWGAEKFGFKCPNDQWCPKDHPADIELVRLGPSDDRPTRRPSLKKGARKLVVSLPAGYGDEGIAPDAEDLETAAEFQGAASGLEDAEVDDDEAAEEDVVPEVVLEVVPDEVVVADPELGDAIDLDDAEGDDAEVVVADETVEEEWHE
jgi:hypothetical protein